MSIASSINNRFGWFTCFSEPAELLSADSNQSYLDSLSHDLECLFNSRCISDPDLPESLQQSILGYGLTELADYNFSAQDKVRFQSVLKDAIETYEPRLRVLKIDCIEDSTKKAQNHYTFRVIAKLKNAEDFGMVVFDSSLEPIHRRFEVKGEIVEEE